MESTLGDHTCPICLTSGAGVSITPWSGGSETFDLDCPNCGPHLLSATADVVLGRQLHGATLATARVAHAVHKMPRATLVTSAMVLRLAEQTDLPGPSERIDNVVLHLGRAVEPGLPVEVAAVHLRATIGTVSAKSAQWALQQAQALGFVEGLAPDMTTRSPQQATLTAAGWRRHDELMRSAEGSRHAFMAMKFNDAELDTLFLEHLRPAIGATGFELRRNDGAHKTAGSIDNRMRVEIRTSRFVVCDLTHGNQGAYWEAGFAEGLGRPVFYLCRRDVFEDPVHGPHFDVANQAFVVWDPADPAPAMRELKDMIRATLPAEARLKDGPAAAGATSA